MPDFKDDFSATLDDAVRFQRKFQKLLLETSYIVGAFGSTVTKGKGHDVDLMIVAAVVARKKAHDIAWMLMPFSKQLIYWETIWHSEVFTDIYLNFITHDDFYLDVVIKGIT